MASESNAVVNPIGLYKDPASGQYLGAIDEIQADAMVQQGWILFAEGRDAAMSTQANIDSLKQINTVNEPDNTKGKK